MTPSSNPASEIGLFAKHWTPGRVKTRLASKIGDRAAAAVAHAFLQTLVERLTARAESAVLGFAPAEAREAFAELAPSWELRPQSDGDLGQRMQRHFEASLAGGVDRVLLLGADSPNVPLDVIGLALQRLEEQRLVLGPTDDGGYYLIGVRGELPPVFDDMPWSTPELWAATTGRLAERGWQSGRDWSELPPWYDVDTADDLRRLQGDLLSAEEPTLQELDTQLRSILADAPPSATP